MGIQWANVVLALWCARLAAHSWCGEVTVCIGLLREASSSILARCVGEMWARKALIVRGCVSL